VGRRASPERRSASLVRPLTPSGTAAGSPDVDRPGLLIFFAPADHPHRDAACATLAWVAAAEGLRFECYYDSFRSGAHYGGGAPWRVNTADLRGGTFTGAHHLEQLLLLAGFFECQAACLGDTAFGGTLSTLGIPIRARSGDIAEFYRELFAGGSGSWPDTLLVIGRGSSPGTSLIPFACHEVTSRRLLAIAEGDPGALEELGPGLRVERLWSPQAGAEPTETAQEATRLLGARTAEMARRLGDRTRAFLLGDSELVGRWIPAAVHNRWAPIFGVPQGELIGDMSESIGATTVVYGRQQDDADFLALSELGVAFQLIDAGRPPFPIIRDLPPARTSPTPEAGPSDEQLRIWSREGRILSTLLFWTGMIRELESVYALADLLSLTGMRAGIVLSTESFRYMPQPPLSLIQVPLELGGLAPRVEPLIASAGIGAMIESAAPPERFAQTLLESVEELVSSLGESGWAPKGWWAVMDAPLHPHRVRRIGVSSRAPFVKLRYPPRRLDSGPGDPAPGGGPADLRSRVRDSPLGRFFEPIRPFDDRRPGRPSRSVLEAVAAAGFEYAFTKAMFGGVSASTTLAGLTVLNQTAGRWDGWTPFVTVNGLVDLRRAERRLLRGHRPGWLAGSLDTCLWAFTGPRWDRSAELKRICQWVAEGGSSGRLINATPGTVARYAKMLSDQGVTAGLDVS